MLDAIPGSPPAERSSLPQEDLQGWLGLLPAERDIKVKLHLRRKDRSYHLLILIDSAVFIEDPGSSSPTSGYRARGELERSGSRPGRGGGGP